MQKKDDVSNYRPISLLPQLSKILEKIYAKRLSSFISSNNILSNCQYGFREKTSTSHALEDATNYISSCLERRLLTMGIFIDLRKAFDTVDHNILLKKLEF